MGEGAEVRVAGGGRQNVYKLSSTRALKYHVSRNFDPPASRIQRSGAVERLHVVRISLAEKPLHGIALWH